VIDLDRLALLVGLPAKSAAGLTFRSALALQRRHRPGVQLVGEVDGRALDEELQWREQQPLLELSSHEDFNRVTEEGAEAIALALAGSMCAWRVIRRLQSRLSEGADWLLSNERNGASLVLEVGGTDQGELKALLARKIDQARRSPFSERGRPAACVVRFLEPRAILWSEDEPR
jgi:hypothetical protein